jgi:hypothetical protein
LEPLDYQLCQTLKTVVVAWGEAGRGLRQIESPNFAFLFGSLSWKQNPEERHRYLPYYLQGFSKKTPK